VDLSVVYRAITGLRRRLRAARLVDRWNASTPGGAAQPGGSEAGDSPNPLREYFDRHAEGPGVQKWLHYFEVYHRHLARFVGRAPVVMEIGVFCGGSLPMWRQYFGAGCRVHGVDIDPECSAFEGGDVTIHIGDQADRGLWKRVREAVPRVDILIDDGGHTPEQQTVALEEMLPHLSHDGVYICEDVHGTGNGFAEYACALARALDAGEIRAGTGVDTSACTPFQRSIHSVHFYPFLVLIEKRELPGHEFSAPQRGTRWRE
jgi:Methyltransferase domain